MADGSSGSGRKRVVIAGAGIAGMSAAHVLSSAGFDVTVLEKADAVGGRCASYFDEELGHTVEHGIHGVFPRYANLRGLWRDAGIGDHIFTTTKTTGLSGHDRAMKSTELAKASGMAPLFLTEMVPPGVLQAVDYALAMPVLMHAYAAHRRDPSALDDETFASLLRRSGVSGRMARLLLIPYVKNLAYARGDEVSARVAVEALAYYVLEHADHVKAQWIDGGMVPLVLDPWRKWLASRGVRFRLGVPAESLVFEDGRLVAIATRSAIHDRELGDAPRLFMRQVGAKYLGLHWEPQKRRLRAFDGACTHQGCRLEVATVEHRSVFSCPCHGGQFDTDGNVLRAPPQRPLPQVSLRRDERAGTWVLDEGPDVDGDGVERADYGIVALDLASLKAIFPRELSLEESTAGIPLLRTTSVTVLRMRFGARPGTARWSGPDSGVFAADDLLDNFFALHTMQREFAAMEDLFLECHIGNCEHFGSLEDDDIYARALEVLEAYFPDEELGRRFDRKRSRVLRHVDVFPLCAPGDQARTPTVSHPSRPNLMLAGDWVRPDEPGHRGFFMERAAITGIEAANAILRAEGRADRQRAIATHPSPLTSRLLAAPILAGESFGDRVRRWLDLG